MKTIPYDYQEKIAQDIVASGDYSKALLMKMGTGKTITSLRVFELLWEANAVDKLLVICIKNKIEDWNNEIEEQWKWPPQYSVINFESIWRAKRKDWYSSFIDSRTMIIIDESHKIKSAYSKVTQFLMENYNKTKYKLILTGTPQSQEYVDYQPQMRFINSLDFDMDYKKWERIYVNKELDTSMGHYFYVIKGYNFTDVLDKAISDKSYYHDYESQYDKPIEIYQDIEHSKESIKFHKDRVWRDPDEERCDDVIADTQMALRTYLRQSYSGFIRNYDIESPKEEWLKEFLEIEPGRIVIFANFVKEIEKIKDVCEKAKRPVSLYYGAEKNLDNFKKYDNSIAIVNYASGAVGINDLCISNIGIFYSPPDGDHILMEQAKARLDRIGQTKQPVFYYLQTKGSLEKAIYANLKLGIDFDNRMFENWLANQ